MAEIDELESPAVAKALPLSAPQQSPGKRPKRSWLGWVALAAVAGGIVWYFVAHPAGSAAAGKGAGNFPVPIVAGTVKTEDFPIYLDGIGTVQAFNTVTVRSRVDGELKQIDFVEGQHVKKGDTLAQIDPAPYQTALDQATGKRLTDAATLANANLDMQRDIDLFARKVISQQDYATQQALVAQLTATVAADEGAVAAAQVQLDYTNITSPLDGLVGIRQVDEGNIILAAGTSAIVVVTQLQPISVIFTLPEQDLEQIQKVSPLGTGLTVMAVDRDDSTVLDTGTLAVIDNQIDQTTGTIRLKANFPNPNYRLWPGGFVNGRLLLTTRHNGIVVPATVVQQGPDGAFAYLVSAQQTAVVQPVKVAQISGTTALIDSGLTPGQTVVVDGQYKLQPGSKVKIAGAAPGANAAGSPGASPAHHHSHGSASPSPGS